MDQQSNKMRSDFLRGTVGGNLMFGNPRILVWFPLGMANTPGDLRRSPIL